jgi:uncharacterized Zn-binding protein involved in type VI secretion
VKQEKAIMPAAARVLDPTNHPGMISAGSPDVWIDNQPAARATDVHTCALPPVAGPHPPNSISVGSRTVLINNLQAARQFDLTGCGATILGGSPTVQIGG